MKRILFFTVAFLLLFVFAACAPSPMPPDSGEIESSDNSSSEPETTYPLEETYPPEMTDPPEIKTAKFDFDISLGDFKVIESGEHFMYDTDMIALDLTVTTTCTSGQYKYYSTVTPGFDGGIPTLILPDGSEIKHDPIEKAMGSDNVDIKKGDKIERFWRFMLPADFAPGEYDIRIDLDNGQTKIFEDILIEF